MKSGGAVYSWLVRTAVLETFGALFGGSGSETMPSKAPLTGGSHLPGEIGLILLWRSFNLSLRASSTRGLSFVLKGTGGPKRGVARTGWLRFSEEKILNGQALHISLSLELNPRRGAGNL